jgi:hypothetical protein
MSAGLYVFHPPEGAKQEECGPTPHLVKLGGAVYLKHLNARYLKIDSEFVRDLVSNDTDQKVVKSIVDIAHSLEKQTIAEGVEDAATLTALKDRGVDFAQGFYLGRPKRLSLSSIRSSHEKEMSPQLPESKEGQGVDDHFGPQSGLCRIT